MASTTRLFQHIATRPVAFGLAAVGTGTAFYAHSRYQNASRYPGERHNGGPFSIASASEPAIKTPWSQFFFTEIELAETRDVNHNVKFLRFKLPEGHIGISPITSMLTKQYPSGAWTPVMRPYTPIDSDEPGYLSFLVKKYPNGQGSGALHSLKPGDKLKILPLPEFDYKPNEFSHLTILAGGAGITPFLQLIRRVLRDPSDRTSIHLVFANTTEEDILLKDELDRLAAERADRFKATYVVSETPASGSADYVKGHITRQIIEQALPADEADRAKLKVLVCGPDPMVHAVAGKKGYGFSQGPIGGYLKELGFSKTQVHKF